MIFDQLKDFTLVRIKKRQLITLLFLTLFLFNCVVLFYIHSTSSSNGSKSIDEENIFYYRKSKNNDVSALGLNIDDEDGNVIQFKLNGHRTLPPLFRIKYQDRGIIGNGDEESSQNNNNNKNNNDNDYDNVNNNNQNNNQNNNHNNNNNNNNNNNEQKEKKSDYKNHLAIVIPTVPRYGSKDETIDYLTDTLSSIESQIEEIYDTFGLKLSIYVYNNSPFNHSLFYQLQEVYTLKGDMYHFQDNIFTLEEGDIVDQIVDDHDNPFDKPGKRVQKQTLDIIKILSKVKSKAEYVLLMEDDFPLCNNSLSIFNYIIHKSNLYNPFWDLIRTSFGLNGFLIRSNSIEGITKYLYGNRYIKPSDILLSEWMCGMREMGLRRVGVCNENKRNGITFRWNLFNHIGKVSSLRLTHAPRIAQCWQDYSSLLLEFDQYNYDTCNEDDLSPCQEYNPQSHMITDLNDWAYFTHYIKSFLVNLSNSKDGNNKGKNGKYVELAFVQRRLPPIYQYKFDAKDTNLIQIESIHNYGGMPTYQQDQPTPLKSLASSGVFLFFVLCGIVLFIFWVKGSFLTPQKKKNNVV
ncbi:hypothetical protein CYY_007274 [Polysphondylium violaceum]|uniref:Glycosyltransferase n=1 Tax=Polysphondylium violaceum TaxID=133409 RepID=A0A8J4PNV3_9MYCE|nr:hypothetical protein CYY_007274 [Polysphondylium violaceum]